MTSDEDKIFSLSHELEGFKFVDFEDVRIQLSNSPHRVTTKINYHDQSATLRYYLNFNEKRKIFYHNEINSLQKLLQDGTRNQPEILEKNDEKGWVIESYLDGKISGKLYGFDLDFLNNIDPGDFVRILTKIKLSKPKLLEWQGGLNKFYEDRFEFVTNNWPFDEMKPIDYWRSLYLDSIKGVLVKNLAFSHGDLNPGNIIYKDQRIIGFIDWESSKYDGYFRDFASVYYLASGDEHWRDKFLKGLKLDNETKKQFNFFYLYYLLIDIALLESAIKKGENKLFRSGEMTDGEMKSIIRRNFLQSLQVVK
ncbi:MAG: Phosphotransferase enzyme family protein [Chloroflexi bacterium ADurb.Bin344]|nr:MAG: Phosphotransferase enzyme family protein [Chloroflexi bacterium ADurb.Bin344]